MNKKQNNKIINNKKSVNIKITFSYNGKNYFGLQKQKDKQTVQGEIENALLKLFKQNIEITIAGRTDKGVSAQNMVANFFTDYNILPEKICYALNVLLPDDIRILKSEEVETNFNARFCAKQKTYCYAMYESRFALPLFPFESQVKTKLCLKNMKKAMKYLKGKHDFTSFVTNSKQYENCERTIFKLRLIKKSFCKINHYYFDFTGDGFLYNQVRTMVGTILLVGLNKIKPKDIKNILKCKNRSFAGKVMPSEGLTLIDIKY